MNVEIITIGDELLIGQVIDSNSAWIGRVLNESGFDVVKKTTISDNRELIQNTLSDSLASVDIVLITGGLGPTLDDITKSALCEYFDMEQVFSEEVFEDIKNFLSSEEQDINSLNRDQAMIPEGCSIIRNSVGTAPIMWFERNKQVVISMPGVPLEMKTAMKNSIIPRLEKNYDTGDIVHRTLSITGIPESDLAGMIQHWEENLPVYLQLAYLPSPGRVRLRITGKSRSKIEMVNKIDSLVAELKPIVGKSLWGVDDDLPEVLVGRFLTIARQTISCAESCTGGNIAHQLSRHSGSSVFFNGGVVAYHNDVKEAVLGVKKSDLTNYGAVSRPVVEQMALGVKKLMNTDWAVATSGIAGPTGGTDEKPVGTIWIAWAGPDGVHSRKFQFGNIREHNIISATESALVGLLINNNLS